MNGKSFLERALGIQARPAEMNLLLMKKGAIQYYRSHPKEYERLKRMRSEIKACNIGLRTDGLPEWLREVLKLMDFSGLPSDRHAVITMIFFQIDGIIEEIDGED
jgi:hypothetical protein